MGRETRMNSSSLTGEQYAQLHDHAATFQDFLRGTLKRMDELHFPPADTLRESVTRLTADVEGFAGLMLRMKSAAEAATGKDPLGPKRNRPKELRDNWAPTADEFERGFGLRSVRDADDLPPK
jgi:hypothetical protein